MLRSLTLICFVREASVGDRVAMFMSVFPRDWTWFPLSSYLSITQCKGWPVSSVCHPHSASGKVPWTKSHTCTHFPPVCLVTCAFPGVCYRAHAVRGSVDIKLLKPRLSCSTTAEQIHRSTWALMMHRSCLCRAPLKGHLPKNEHSVICLHVVPNSFKKKLYWNIWLEYNIFDLIFNYWR